MTTNEDPFNLPVEDRCVHKLWKVRISGYEDAIKLFRHLDKKSHEWNKFIGVINNFVTDSNVVAQEKGLEAALVFVENSESAGRLAEEVMAVLVSKCYGVQKEKIRSIALQITLMFIEIEKQDVVIEELVKGMDHKFPKIVSACIRAVTQSIKDFGSKVINIKPILKKLQSILENKDQSVRVEAKLLTVILYSWVGLAPVKANLTNLKPLQIQDLQVEFEKLTDMDKPQPTRYLRSHKKQTDKIEVEANEDFTEEESIYIVDNFEESIDPVNILDQLNEDFYQKLEVKQWQERKKAIDKLEEMLSKAPKLDIGDYGNLVKALMKMIEKDTNVIIVSIATKCITMLARRLKKRFEMYTSVCVPVFLEKFKEKKPSVVLPLREAIDAIYLNITLESIHEYVLTAIGSKNPSVRAESVSFLGRCFTKCSTTVLNKKMLKNCINALVKTLNESDPTVRNNSAEALGIAWKIVSEKNILPFLTNVDATKLAKIKEAAKNAIITVKSIPTVNECSPKCEKIKETAINNKSTDLKKNPGDTNKINCKTKKLNNFVKDANNCEKLDFKINLQNIGQRVDITSQITDSLIDELSDKDWNVRSNALTKLQNIISEAKFITSNLGQVQKALQDRISDSNARLCSNSIHLLEIISIAMGSSFKNYIKCYLPGVLNALGDLKTFKFQSARHCMNTWADVCGFREFFGNDIILDALKNNSVTLRSELWTWLAVNLPVVPLKTIPTDELKHLLPALYSSFEDKNCKVREASEKVVLGFMMHLGYASMYAACEELKPLSAKFCREKLDKVRPNLPIISNEKHEKKVVKSGSSVKLKQSKFPPNKGVTKINHENAISCSSLVSGCMDIKSLFQQNNLKHQRCLKVLKWDPLRKEMVEQLQEQMQTANINKTLITNMFHLDFKYHLKALNTLLEDLNATDDNKSGLICNLDLVLKWITLRFFDTNPSVLTKSLEYLQQMFNMLMEKKYTLLDIEVSCFVPYLISKLGDPKNTVRSNVRSILKQNVSIFPGTKVFIYIMDGMNSKNSRQHSECLEHLTTMIEDHGSSICQPSIEDVCKKIAVSVGDTSVRRQALDCLVALFFSHGDDVLKLLGHIPEKNMDLLKERLRRASMNEVVPVATVQPTIKMSISPIQKVLDTEDTVNSDSENYNNMSNVLEESNYEQSLKKYSDNLLPRKPVSEITNTPQLTRFSLDEKIIRELDAEVITRPKLSLTPYKWTTEYKETNLKKTIQVKSQYFVNNLLSKPYHNVNSNYSAVKITRHPATLPFPVDLIEQLINELTSLNTNISKAAMTSLNKILLRSNMRSKFLETGKVLPLYSAIIKQFDVFEFHDIVGYKMLLHLCLNMSKYQEFMLALNGQTVRGLLLKLLHFLSKKGPESCNDIIGKCVNSLIMSILDQTDHTIVTCTLLVMIYDTIKYPETSTTFFKELLMKCLWKVIKDFHKWDGDLNYDLVLVHIHKFLEEFDLNYWRKQPSDTPWRTYKTVLHTLVKLHSDKILKSLSSLQLPDDSEIVMYLLKLLQHQKNKQF